MAISIFPSTAAEFVSNNFVVDMNDSTNNTADTGGVKQAGPYSMSFSSGDSSFDVYLIDDEGNSVGYSNGTSITASGLFTSVVILGVATDEIITFNYSGSVNNADGEGDEPGAGAYLESISPTDLPSIDDTATVTGGNFASDVEINFVSGATELSAKSITVNNSTELLVTRPDGLIEDDAPYTLKAINPGVTPPTGSNAHLLVDEVTAGSDPTWVTTSPLNVAITGEAFSQTLEATDSEGTVVDYSVTAGTITPGLTLNSSTGVLSGTATTSQNNIFTVTATDDGGNTTDREFEQLSGSGITGGAEFDEGGFRYHLFTSSDDLFVFESESVEYLIIAGGGGGGRRGSLKGANGGDAGQLVSGTATASSGSYSIQVGSGGAERLTGSPSSFESFGTASGGAGGGTTSSSDFKGGDGGDGAGGAGGTAAFQSGASGGVGVDTFSAWATATGTGADSGYYAGGGGGGAYFDRVDQGGPGGLGGGGNGGDANLDGENGATNTGSGGGAMGDTAGGLGGSGIVIVRYAI